MSEPEDNLRPSTDILLQECPRARILVLGKSGAGKSALINAVFGTNLTEVSHSKAGSHDIERELTSRENERLVVHDSQGFEFGDTDKLEKVQDFIRTRSTEPTLADRLHGIWICAEIPHANDRLFEIGVEEVLKTCPKDLPVIVVFTKLDLLRTKVEEEVAEREADVADEDFEELVNTEVDSFVDKLCVRPLRELVVGGNYSWAAISTRSGFDHTIRRLVDMALEKVQLESVWLALAIAQRSRAEDSLKASVKVGRKKWWSGLFSDIFLGLSMQKVTGVLHLDIVRIWNMNDPNKYLLSPEFFALVTVLVEDLDERPKIDYSLTKNAAQSLTQNPHLIPITGPTLALAFLVEWIKGSYKKTKSSLRCMAAYIIDLSLTMDTLFYFTRGGRSVDQRLINKALVSYQIRKGLVHEKIRSWIGRLESKFDHLDPTRGIDEMARILREHCINPEKGVGMHERDGTIDMAWISADALRAAA